MSIWIAREKTGTRRGSYYSSFQCKPRRHVNSYGEINYYANISQNGYNLGTYCPEIFEHLSDMHLEPGDMMKIKGIKFII